MDAPAHRYKEFSRAKESGNNVWPTTSDFNASIYEEEHRLNLSRETKSIHVSILFKLLMITSLCHLICWREIENKKQVILFIHGNGKIQ